MNVHLATLGGEGYGQNAVQTLGSHLKNNKREKHVKKGIGIERAPLNNGNESHICLNATFQRLISFFRNFFCRNFSPVLLVEFIWGEEVLFAGAEQAPKFYTREAKQQFWREILSMSRVLKLNND